MRLGRHLGRHLACLAVLGIGASVATAEFNYREISTTGFNLNNHYEAYMTLMSEVDFTILDDLGNIELEDEFVVGAADVRNNGGGHFTADEPGAGSGDDYVGALTAKVTIPAGTWEIAFGSDDGGQLTMQTLSGDPIAFGRTFRENGRGTANSRILSQGTNPGTNQVWFVGNRGHQWTGGIFTVSQETEVLLHSSFHERGGGDSFEIAIHQGDAPNDNPRQANSWELLVDGVHGWKVEATDDRPELNVAGLPSLGDFEGDRRPASFGGIGNGIQQQINTNGRANTIFQYTRENAGTYEEGLRQTWIPTNNRGNLNANADQIVADHGDKISFVAPVNFTGNAAGPIGLEDFPQYPTPLTDDGGSHWDGARAGDQNNYIVHNAGQINLPEGDIVIRDGVDDFTYLAIDLNRSGIMGDSEGEIILNDNQWNRATSAIGLGNSNNAQSNGITVAEAGWYDMELIIAEGGGGDSQMLYWDQNDDAGDFPYMVTVNFEEDAQAYVIPEENFRTDVTSVDGLSRSITLAGDNLNIGVSSDLVDADHIGNTLGLPMNLADANINLHVEGGDLVPGDSFVPFASEIENADQAFWLYPEGTTADDWINHILDGTGNRITYVNGEPFGDCNGDGQHTAADLDCVATIEDRDFVIDALNTWVGDLDGNGDVSFQDFLKLAANFGDPNKTKYTEGDINLTGGPQFNDFLALAANFGNNNAAVAAVPEPASASLIALALAFAGLQRKRRRAQRFTAGNERPTAGPRWREA